MKLSKWDLEDELEKLQIFDCIHLQAGDMVPTRYMCSRVSAICLHMCVGRSCQGGTWIWRGTDPQPLSGAEIPRSDRRWREGIGADEDDASTSAMFLENSLLSASCWGRSGLCRAEKERDSPGSQQSQVPGEQDSRPGHGSKKGRMTEGCICEALGKK